MSEEKWFNCYEGSRDGLFTRDSNRHPAKMAVALCFKIFEHGERMGYWAKGDLVLDPMAGIFTTGVCGAIMGYRVVGVELEQHFFKLAQENIAFARPKFHVKGDCEILQGDARHLSELLRPKGIVSSPPYLDQRMASAVCFKARKLYREGKVAEALVVLREQEAHEIESGWARAPRSEEHLLQRLKDDATDGYDAAVASPPYGDVSVISGAGMTHAVLEVARTEGMKAAVAFYRKNVMDKQKAHGRWTDENIQYHIEMALATREAGSGYTGAVASPPYADQQITQDSHFRSAREPNRPDAANDGRARYSGAVISPRFTMPEGGGKGIAKTGHRLDPSLANRQYVPEQFSNTGAQIGNLRDPKGDIDAVLSSPPFEDREAAKATRKFKPDFAEKQAALYKSGKMKGHPASAEAIQRDMDNQQRGLEISDESISKTTGETYLSAMLSVYRELYRVLRPFGVVALVTKNPVKKGQIRRLDLDTIKLMQASGFTLLEHKKAMLAEETVHGHLFEGETRTKRERKSFFKRLFEKKNPHLAVDFEDVLFFQKNS